MSWESMSVVLTAVPTGSLKVAHSAYKWAGQLVDLLVVKMAPLMAVLWGDLWVVQMVGWMDVTSAVWKADQWAVLLAAWKADQWAVLWAVCSVGLWADRLVVKLAALTVVVMVDQLVAGWVVLMVEMMVDKVAV